MTDSPDANTAGLSDGDLDRIKQIARDHLQGGESILHIRGIGENKAEINVGIIINRKSGSGRKIRIEKNAEDWSVTEIQGWMA